jgi:hypothetical protein
MAANRYLDFPRRVLSLASAGLVLLLAGAAIVPASPPAEQFAQQQSTDEVVANLAAGRAAVLIAKDGIVVATAQSNVEPETLPPMIVPLGSYRVAVLLGPVEWMWPGSGRAPLRLDRDLQRRLWGAAAPVSKDAPIQASDIETIGLGFLEPLRIVTATLHGRLRLPPQEVFTEMLLVDYARDYGPEAWSLRYHAEQELMRGDFYRTSIHRPEYVQLYPPDKGQPKTLMETTYPPHDPTEPSILELLKSNDSSLAPLRNADPGMGRAADLLVRGESQKINLGDGLELLRAAFQSVAPRDSKKMLLTITPQDGIKWVLGEEESTRLSPEERKQAESGAPTLRKKPELR